MFLRFLITARYSLVPAVTAKLLRNVTFYTFNATEHVYIQVPVEQEQPHLFLHFRSCLTSLVTVKTVTQCKPAICLVL